MKAKTIFKGAVAGLLSMSLFLSGMPVMATEAPDTAAKQQIQEEADGIADGADGAKQQEPEGADAPADGKSEAKPQNQEEPQAPADEKQGTEDTADKDKKTNENPADEKDDTQEKADTQEDDSKKDKTKKDASQEDDTKKDEQESDAPAAVDENVPQAFSLQNLPAVNGKIVIDGAASDWSGVTARTAGLANVDSWKVAYSPDGNTLYFCYTGNAGTEWDYGFASNSNSFKFTYADNVTGEDAGISVSAWNGGAVVKNAFWGDIQGAEAAVTNEAHGNNPGPYTVEFSVPVSFFHSQDFTLSFGDTVVNAGEIEQLNGNEAVEEAPAVYNGISIDGNYSDWAAVAKTDVNCPNDQHPGCLSQVAAVYDGDWFYIYIKDGEGSNASGAGTHSNGKFAITSDLGYETDIQLSTAPSVSGVDGAQVSYVGSEWEIAIPKSQLPKYEKSLSFGFYLGEAIVGDIVNLQADNGSNLENLFNGIIYDGQYEDWEDYGHSTIEYATAGSQESQIDAKGALYSTGDKLYGHVVTNMPQHLQEAGGEFTSAVTIAFNQSENDLRNRSFDWQMAFYPRCVTVDAAGNINWNPQLSGLPEGTYEFYLASTDAWHTSTNINNLNEMDQLYGKMIMTIAKDGKDEMEFYLDLPMVAKKLGLDETDLKEIAAQFGRIGQQWIFTAGTSTGPIAGVALCVVSVGLVFWYRKRRSGEVPFPVAG